MRVRVYSAHRQRHRVVFGLFVIVVGLFALLDNLHLFDARLVQPYWPLIFVAVGALKLRQARSAGGYLIGGALVAVGAALTLHNLGILQFRVRDWWPVLLILGGTVLITRGLRPGADGDEAHRPGMRFGGRDGDARHERFEHGSRIDTSAVLSGSVLKNDTQDFRGGEVNAVMGGVQIDLRQASIRTEAVLHIFAMWGGIQIRVPEDWSIVVTGTPVLGGIEDKTVPPMNATKRLVVEGVVIMGGVEIRN